FSSRRRHTRSYGDWSSDVCSSDLAVGECADGSAPAVYLASYFRTMMMAVSSSSSLQLRLSLTLLPSSLSPQGMTVMRRWLGMKRSEERRVGKGCRSKVAVE